MSQLRKLNLLSPAVIRLRYGIECQNSPAEWPSLKNILVIVARQNEIADHVRELDPAKRERINQEWKALAFEAAHIEHRLRVLKK